MGRPIRQVGYNFDTNTVSGVGVYGLPIRIHVFAAEDAALGAKAELEYDAVINSHTGRFSVELEGIEPGDYVIRWAPRDIPLHAAASSHIAMTIEA